MFNWLRTWFKPAPASQPQPQLEMLRDNLETLPNIALPEGYKLRTYRPGDEAAWCTIMGGNVGQNWTVEKCREELIQDPRFQPKNLFFITYNRQPIASVCAWSNQDPDIGEVHMVAALETHRGRGLGHVLNAAVLHRLKTLGYKKAHLKTDDWRMAAVKSYFTAGFRPHHTHASHPDRWKKISQQLGIPDPTA